MKCANRGLFVCLKEGGQGRENGTTRLFWQFHFFQCFGVRDNHEVWIGKGKVITFCCLYPCLSCKEKRSDCFKHGSWVYLQFWLSSLSGKMGFLTFHQPCILLNLHGKFDKHTNSSLAWVFVVCIDFRGVDWSGEVQILLLTTQSDEKNWCLEDLSQCFCCSRESFLEICYYRMYFMWEAHCVNRLQSLIPRQCLNSVLTVVHHILSGNQRNDKKRNKREAKVNIKRAIFAFSPTCKTFNEIPIYAFMENRANLTMCAHIFLQMYL